MNVKRIRIIVLSTVAVVFPAVLFAQTDPMAPPTSQTQPNQPRQAQPSTTSMQDSIGNNGDTVQAMRDKMFLRKAAKGGLAEITLGRLAAQKASSDEVKAFGQKMVDDHTKLNDDMAPIAESMGVMLPKKLSKTDQAEYDKLNGLSGDAFDKEYLAYMVKDYHEDLREFRIESTSTSDATLKAAVDKGAQVIHEHMVMVDKLAKERGVVTPGGRNRPTPPPAG
jgi:putative membrane protein